MGDVFNPKKTKPHTIKRTFNTDKYPKLQHLILGLFIIIFTLQIILINEYKDRVYSNVFFQNNDVSGYNRTEFEKLIKKKLNDYTYLDIVINSSPYRLNLSDINFGINTQGNWEMVLGVKRTFPENFFPALFFWKKIKTAPQISLDQEMALSELDKIIALNSSKVIPEMITLADDEVVIKPGKDGYDIDKYALLDAVKEAVSLGKSQVNVSPKMVSSSIPQEVKNILLTEAVGLIGKKISVVSDDGNNYEINDKDLIESLNDWGSNSNYMTTISNRISERFNRPAKDSIFVFENGRITEFTPSEDGIIVDSVSLKKEILAKREELSTSPLKEIDLPPSLIIYLFYYSYF